MTKLSLALLIHILAHLTGPGLVYAPVQDSYRVEVMRAKVRQTEAIRLWAIRNGVKVNEMGVWK